MRNSKVAEAWANGDSAASQNMSTDGVDLYSYNLKIASRVDGLTRIWDYTASGSFKSQTTSTHVGHALRAADGYSLLMVP
jgi:hypothetical protein